MAKGVKILERKFCDIEKQLSAFIAFVDTFVEDDKEVLSFKLSQFDRLNAKYESVKEEIFTSLSDLEFNNFDGKITTCNEHIEKLEVRLKFLNLKYSKNNNETGSNAVSNVVKPCFRLPELSLPQFNGDIETWFIFKEQFKEIIENCGLNDKQKLQYLQSCLIGIAKHVQTVDDTYDSLFLALEQRFENKRLIINKHINALLMLKYEKFRGDSNVELRNLVDTCTKHLRALKLLKIEHNTFSELLLIQLVMQVLDTETKRLFEMTLESTDIPKWDDFLAFLNKRCLFLENLPSAGTKDKQNFKDSPRHKSFILHTDANVDKKFPLRVLADSGSQVSLLRSSTADFLNLRKLKTDMSVSGLGGSNVNIKSKIKRVISNGSGSYKRVVDFHVVPKITNMIPVNSFDISHIVFPSNVHLADPTFNTSNSIDALLSADIFFDILKDGKYKLDNGNLILQNTGFGYIISGNTSRFSSGSLHCGLITKDFETLNDTLKSFWEIEEIVPTKFVSDELKKCDEHFLKTMARDTNGRFCVEMPMKDNDIELGQSKSTAIRRLKLLERRFVREPHIKDKYVEFLQEYEDLDHMQRVKEEEPGLHYYIPHHAVIRPESKSTKLRVVFDASCKSSNGNSLNDILLKGGTIQPDLFDILLRFRKYVVAFSSDIKKMFRQIKVQEHQQDFLRIFWRRSPEEDIVSYRLKTVTYGTKPAPYLATRCLLQPMKGRTSAYLPLQLSKIAPTWMTFCQEQTTSLLLKRCSDN
ncbi:integrase catalytic domain-containing protein [Trichonephila clavata]|uniref:Integrase catalytic domain-containing protein n=1 Tax=Trichonephila clavata TaxID=2740835 RepID=A0A8X6L8C2_TRICU|nr:integrase catalytic domain-containing protein [Trichonephila clavata]